MVKTTLPKLRSLSDYWMIHDLKLDWSTDNLLVWCPIFIPLEHGDKRTTTWWYKYTLPKLLVVQFPSKQTPLKHLIFQYLQNHWQKRGIVRETVKQKQEICKPACSFFILWCLPQYTIYNTLPLIKHALKILLYASKTSQAFSSRLFRLLQIKTECSMWAFKTILLASLTLLSRLYCGKRSQ